MPLREGQGLTATGEAPEHRTTCAHNFSGISPGKCGSEAVLPVQHPWYAAKAKGPLYFAGSSCSVSSSCQRWVGQCQPRHWCSLELAEPHLCVWQGWASRNSISTAAADPWLLSCTSPQACPKPLLCLDTPNLQTWNLRLGVQCQYSRCLFLGKKKKKRKVMKEKQRERISLLFTSFFIR